MTRAERKLDHIKHALSTGQSRATWLDDIRFVHQALPDSSWDKVSLQTQLGELVFGSPFYINAMTGGGGARTTELNSQLARISREMNIPMAVGSQMAAIKNPEEIATFATVRKENPDGLIFANLGSEASVDQAKRAVDMLEANALQIHLNVIQELTMPEGDRDFSGALSRIEQLVNDLDIPVIVKETGFGISREAAMKLQSINVAAIDIGGFGGTNFAAIENERRHRKLSFFNDWGIPTAAALIETTSLNSKVPVLASGGIQHALDMVKCLSLGASAVGLAGKVLKTLVEEGEQATIEEIKEIIEDLTMLMVSLGANTIEELQKVPLIISGELHHYLTYRGIDTYTYANRK
ncbi:type 2 isopentenyl-diphosphate Delta-isomerase [Paenisporosarcina sp. OV554]|uniref:type 2 isopentenyl-diphosphate Delta-isomerase n=1 Tax=Paenisporosarcina sp. OV554 TaxID=2135694 RepID=UPI000D3836F0|nr:type 2 isopentenyl-diphosphate Delta-isomerase [Paenisporosarcina sp. OV554]PUB10345.1 isopentenyl-diphosphate delta-isomerase [Paenisporosarcina sp. OV554]